MTNRFDNSVVISFNLTSFFSNLFQSAKKRQLVTVLSDFIFYKWNFENCHLFYTVIIVIETKQIATYSYIFVYRKVKI